jgi:hypothetical protein
MQFTEYFSLLLTTTTPTNPKPSKNTAGGKGTGAASLTRSSCAYETIALSQYLQNRFQAESFIFPKYLEKNYLKIVA